MNYDQVARHEAAHVAACLCLHIPIYGVECTATSGTTHVWPEDFDEAQIRDHALMVLVGPICSEGEAGEVPDWPPRLDAPQKDERELAYYSRRLELDEAGWNRLVLDACRLATSPRFEAIYHETLGELERRPALDYRALYRIVADTYRRNTP